MTRCHEIRPYLEAFADDELSTESYLRVEAHLGSCLRCAEEVELTRSLKRSLQDTVLEVRPSWEFMNRLSRVIADECRYEEQKHRAQQPSWRRRIVPVAAAAAALLTVGLSEGNSSWLKPWLGGSWSWTAAGSASEVSSVGAQEASVIVNPRDIIDQLVQYHQSSLEPEVTERSALLRFEPQVGVPMRVPELRQYGARFLGASVVPVERYRAASLRYNVSGHRVTVYVFNPQVVSVRALHDLQLRVIGDRAVFVGIHNGYSIAAVEERGVGYMVATDLDDRESAELVASIH